MTISISDGFTTTNPIMVVGYNFAQSSRSIVHDVPGRTDSPVTIFGADSRTGTLELLYSTTAAADAARELLGLPSTFTFADTEQTDLAFSFVVVGDISMEQRSASRRTWVVSVGFREVTG